MPTQEDVYNSLSRVVDPELNLPITDLGLIYDVQVDGTRVDVKMTLTSMGCPMGASITDQAREIILELDGVTEANVELIWDPPWSVDMMSDEARMQLGML